MSPIRTIVIRAAAIAALLAPPALGAAAPIPRELDMGPHAVGFRSIERYDRSRVFREKLGPGGAVRPGERSRPVYLYLWYPAEAAVDAPRMVYGEYSFANPADPAFYPLAARLQEREIYGALYPFFGGQRGSVVDLMNVATAAVRDAKPLAGSYPMILYLPDLRGSAGENALLCEYLASHGYVVAATQPLGTLLRDPSPVPDDLESLLRDAEFALGELRAWPQSDPARLGLAGRAFGGVTALLLAMRSSDVDAVVALGGWNPPPGRGGLLTACSGWRPERFEARTLAVRAENEAGAFARVDSLVHATRYLATTAGGAPGDFAGYGALAASMATPPPGASAKPYADLCGLARLFLDGALRGRVDGTAALEAAAGGAPLAGVRDLRIEPGSPAPLREDRILAVFWEEGVTAGIGLLGRLRAEGVERPLPPATLNTLGYQFLAAQRLEEAVEIFRAASDLYPGSANAWASLGEACLYADRAEEARGCYRKTLELLSVDTDLDEGTREALKTQAEETLKRLGE